MQDSISAYIQKGIKTHDSRQIQVVKDTTHKEHYLRPVYPALPWNSQATLKNRLGLLCHLIPGHQTPLPTCSM